MTLTVECRYEPERGDIPVRFGTPGCMRIVTEVLDTWHGDRYRDFRLRTEGEGVYILRHDLRAGAWAIHAFRDG